MNTIAILKTDVLTLQNVVNHAKHACMRRPARLTEGDLVLISQTFGMLRPGQKPIRYMMEFVSSYADHAGESERIFGRHWNYIVEGRNMRELRYPFDMDEIKKSSFNYRDAQWLAYVRPQDLEVLRQENHLEEKQESL